MTPHNVSKSAIHSSDPRFVDYYARESQSAETLQRFRALRDKVIGLWSNANGRPATGLVIADVGCGAGASSALWAELGHRVRGLDINAALIEIAQLRADESRIDATFEVGTATALPWTDASVDICMLPELLEHVVGWEAVLAEANRVLKPGGALYLSTTNVLCPMQQEFTLPGYSWYPGPVKRKCVDIALTSHPEIANFATYPAVNWFSYSQLARFLGRQGLTCSDRFDMMNDGALPAPARVALALIRRWPAARFLAHVATPYLALFAVKQAPDPRA